MNRTVHLNRNREERSRSSNDPSCTVVFYHYVRDVERTRFAGIKALSTADFAAQLDWLGARFRILDGPAFERAALGGERPDGPTALLTFDDGFVDHYEHAFPEMRRRQMGGVFFVSGSTLGDAPELLNVHKTHLLLSALGADRFGTLVTERLQGLHVVDASGGRDGIYRYDEAPDVVAKRLLNYELSYDIADRLLDELFREHVGDPVAFARELYLSADMIAEMAYGGMTFGYHTRSHRVLSRLSRQEQEAELLDGVDLIQRLTGQRTVSFCYPYGFTHTYNQDTLDVLAQAGYSVAFNTVRQPARLPVPSRYEVPRFDTRDVVRHYEAQVHA
jgi:peptidoglycan/xylan/chitin deacetylase (PgdA/CDA1 family)